MTTARTIDEYLDQLLFELRGREPGLVRRVMRETEDHLRESVAMQSSDAPGDAAAEAATIAAFGPPDRFADGFPKWRRSIARRSLARQGLLCIGVLMVTVGLNGAVLFGFWQWRGEAFAVREGTYEMRLPAYGPCGYMETDQSRPGDWCPRSNHEQLEAEAMARQLTSEVGWQVAIGALGVVMLIGGLRLKGSEDFRMRAFGHRAPVAVVIGLGLAAVFFLYMGVAWGATPGKQGEGWFYAWGIAAAVAFVASFPTLAWHGPFNRIERRRAV